MYDVGHFLPASEVLLLVHARGLAKVEVQVAIAHMTEGHRPDARNQLGHRGKRLLDEAWDMRQGH